MFSLVGPEADRLLQELTGDVLAIGNVQYARHQLLGFGNRAPVVVAIGCGLASRGYNLIADESVAADLYSLLLSKGCAPMGEEDWEVVRVTQGRPAAGAELTEEFNPLEAGLYKAVSVSKGCYIGQETLSKLANTGGVKQQLWGLQMDAAGCMAGDHVSAAGEKVGKVTSVVQKPDGSWFAIGYLKAKSKGAPLRLDGLRVEVGAAAAAATVVDLPYVTRAFVATGAAGASSGVATAAATNADGLTARAEGAQQAKAAQAAAEDAARQERLKAMQARLSAWQQQGGPAASAAQPPPPTQ